MSLSFQEKVLKVIKQKIPCHRVVCSDGKTGGYNRGANLKVKLLQKEKAIDNDF